MEGWVREGKIPLDAPRLRTVRDFQLWTDDQRGVGAWSSFSVAAPRGQNPDLRARLDVVLPLYLSLSEPSKPGTSKLRRGRAISARLVTAERDRLAHQTAELLVRIHALEAAARSHAKAYERVMQENRKLTAELAKLAGFPSSIDHAGG